MSRKHRIRRHYEPRITSERENYDVLDWADAESQAARFGALADSVDLAGRRLLDVGCGLGDLRTYLLARGLDVDYTGVDLLESMVQAARRQHAGGRFLCADVFAEPPLLPAELTGEPFDVVFCSGVFNLDLGNAEGFLPRAVAAMLRLSREYVVWNLLHARTEAKYEHCVYYDPRHVLAMLAPLDVEAYIVEDYLPNDFTVVCRRTPPDTTPGPR